MLQSAGFDGKNTDANAISYVYKSAIRPVLLYCLDCINLNSSCMKELDESQATIVKSALGSVNTADPHLY